MTKTETRVEWVAKGAHESITNEETARLYVKCAEGRLKLIRRTIKTEIVEEEIQ